MKNLKIIIAFILCNIYMTGCQVIETTQELKFSGKFKTEFAKEDNLPYNISGGRENSYSGDGIKGNTFNPYALKPGIYYIFYRDSENYFQRKKTKVKITQRFITSTVCNKCDDNFKIKCEKCSATGQIENILSTLIQCEKCDGDGTVGWIFTETCGECQGIGNWYVTEKILKNCDKCNGLGKHDCECQKE